MSSIIVVAEGDEEGGALEIARKVQALGRFESRVSILGPDRNWSGGGHASATRLSGSC